LRHAVPLFPILLSIHILLAVALVVPSVLLPFALRARHARPARRGRFVRALLWLQSSGSFVIGAGVAATGLGLVALLGAELLRQPWLLAAVAVYAANLVVAFFVQRPNLRRLMLRGDSGGDDERWRANARRQRYVSYLMAAAVGLIAFLMTSKPDLW
jgi:hypothetical protein